MRLKLASRKSDLARWQAHQIGRALSASDSEIQIDYMFKSSLGDQNLDLPLAGMGAKGVFTEDFYQDLVSGGCDLVVHSWKDLPVDERAETRIAMTLPRADVRDLLLIPGVVWEKALAEKKLTVFTSSPRRVYNLGPALPKLLPGNLKLEFKPVRGNVPTRLKKMHEEGSALILAKAGLDRLLEAEQEGGLTDAGSVRARLVGCRFQVLPVSLNPPAPAQGALAVEISREHHEMQKIAARLTDVPTMEAVNRERSILKRYGGGCHQKIGVAVLPRSYGTVLSLRGLTDAGEVLNEWKIENQTPWTRADSLARIFPLEPKQNSWFNRVELPEPTDIGAQDGLIVARAEAWPKGFRARAEQIVWVAGVQTWMRLAAQGIFVNGTFDGLGESEPMELGRILGRDPQMCKLTHEGAEGRAVYRLEPKADSPDLRGKTHFFWMSGSSFARARQLFPGEIKNGFHACGPGHTFEFLRSQSGLKHPPKVFAGLTQFLSESEPK